MEYPTATGNIRAISPWQLFVRASLSTRYKLIAGDSGGLTVDPGVHPIKKRLIMGINQSLVFMIPP
jgi:hypothetical protein